MKRLPNLSFFISPSMEVGLIVEKRTANSYLVLSLMSHFFYYGNLTFSYLSLAAMYQYLGEQFTAAVFPAESSLFHHHLFIPREINSQVRYCRFQNIISRIAVHSFGSVCLLKIPCFITLTCRDREPALSFLQGALGDHCFSTRFVREAFVLVIF